MKGTTWTPPRKVKLDPEKPGFRDLIKKGLSNREILDLIEDYLNRLRVQMWNGVRE